MHCFDNNYVIPAGVAFYSLLENANPNYFYKIYCSVNRRKWQALFLEEGMRREEWRMSGEAIKYNILFPAF